MVVNKKLKIKTMKGLKRIERLFLMFVNDYLDWQATVLRLLWNGAIAVVVAQFTKELFVFSIMKVAGDSSKLAEFQEVGATVAWVMVLIYFLMKIPFVTRDRFSKEQTPRKRVKRRR